MILCILVSLYAHDGTYNDVSRDCYADVAPHVVDAATADCARLLATQCEVIVSGHTITIEHKVGLSHE